jgi:hypothetical protein
MADPFHTLWVGIAEWRAGWHLITVFTLGTFFDAQRRLLCQHDVADRRTTGMSSARRL